MILQIVRPGICIVRVVDGDAVKVFRATDQADAEVAVGENVVSA